MIRYHKCSMCGEVSYNFHDAVNHALSHAFVARSYSTPHLYVCPVCNLCYKTSYEMDECINNHLKVLEELGYI